MKAVRAPEWAVGARSETGYVRSVNEDRMGWLRTSFGDVYVVSDGMGGYRGGATAAAITTEILQKRLASLSVDDADAAAQMARAFEDANSAVFERRQADDPETRDMGATGVAVVTAGARVLVGHVGDSRAYLWRADSGLTRLTRDHSRVQKMVDAGMLAPAQANDHPDASKLERAIGHAAHVDADVSAWMSVQAGDVIVLCTDGLSGFMTDDEIAAVLVGGGEPQALADGLVAAALAKGGADNVTVQLARFGRQPARRGPGLRRWIPGLAIGVAVLASAGGVAAVVSKQQRSEQRIAELETRLTAAQREIDRLNRQVARPAATPATLPPVPVAPVPGPVSGPMGPVGPPAPASGTPGTPSHRPAGSAEIAAVAASAAAATRTPARPAHVASAPGANAASRAGCAASASGHKHAKVDCPPPGAPSSAAAPAAATPTLSPAPAAEAASADNMTDYGERR